MTVFWALERVGMAAVLVQATEGVVTVEASVSTKLLAHKGQAKVTFCPDNPISIAGAILEAPD